MSGKGPPHRGRITLVYKMTHKGDPDPDRRLWGVCDCMGKVRGFHFDAVIGIGGTSWWPNEPNRAGEIVWVGLDPHPTPVKAKRGPDVRFAHFRYFREGEKKRKIPPNLKKAMHKRRYMLYGFSQAEQQEIKGILELAKKPGPSASLFTRTVQSKPHGKECHR